MASEDEVNIFFVVPSKLNENEVSDDMKLAFQLCVDHDLSVRWIREDDCSSLNPTKQDVFVFQEFKGEVFMQFRNLKCVRLLGHRCLASCLMDKCPIPEGNSPVFTTAMRGLIVATTNFSGPGKEELINKIQYMGGLLSPKLISTTTHLVAKNVLSVKYEKAVEKGLPVMTEEWVNAVWTESCKRNVHAKDPEFERYKCPVFHGLTVTCSNLNRQQKEEIRNLISDNGGVFSGQLECEITKVLVIERPIGDKYKYAQEWKLPCVLPSWVHESVKQGYAVPVEPHLTPNPAGTVRCSTPNSDESRLLPDFSMVSTVSNIPAGSATHVNETIADTTIQSFLCPKPPKPRSTGPTPAGWTEVLDRLDLREAKRAGAFLDGCNVYLSGFNPEQTEKLRRVLNGGGATRFSEISDSVTHMIVGDILPSEMKMLKSSGCRPYVVSVKWVEESMKNKCPAPEENFLCSNLLLQSSEPASPLSKKGLQMLRRTVDQPVPRLNLSSESGDEAKEDDVSDLLENYMKDPEPDKGLDNTAVELESKDKPADLPQQQDMTQNTESSQDCTQFTLSSEAPIFNDLTFFIVDHTESDREQMRQIIELRGGRVVGKNFKGVADYAIVPLKGATFSQTASDVVTYMWLEDCNVQNEVVPIQYYHQPISIDEEKRPLKGCVISISSYLGVERDFIFAVSELLGAITQEVFARKSNEKKNALATTHLICSEPGSQKYNAAIKWKRPAINHEWLLACARESQHVKEEPYLVGDSKIDQTLQVPDKGKSITSGSEQNIDRTSKLVSVEKSNQSSATCNTPQGVPRPINKRVEEVQEKGLMGPPSSPLSPQRVVTPKASSHGFSQESPLNIPRLVNTPKPGWPADPSQPTPKGPFHISTPETPYGQVLKPNPSPETRKNWKRWIDNFPDLGREQTPPRKRRNSTPLSELKRRCWEMILPKKTDQSENIPDGSSSSRPEADVSRISGPALQTPLRHFEKETSSSPGLFQKSEGAGTSGEDNRKTTGGIKTQLAHLNDFLNLQNDEEMLENSSGTPVLKRLQSTNAPQENVNQPVNIGKQLTKDSQGVVDWVDPVDMTNKQEKLLKRKFMLSGIQEREHYEKVIRALGGEVTDKAVFDPSSTHLVCSRPLRSEKLLASIASGKWVLHKSYLDECLKAGRFVDEDEYEWGNPAAITLMRDLKPGSLENELAQAGYRWRCRLSKDNSGAFVGVRALVCISTEREEPFKRLILAGGGIIEDFSNLTQATHCFVELNKKPLPVDLSVLVKHRIPCVPPVYLNDYLIKDPAPQAHNCVVAEYKRLLQT